MKLDAEMAVVQRSIVCAVARVMKGKGDIAAQKTFIFKAQPLRPLGNSNRPLRAETRMCFCRLCFRECLHDPDFGIGLHDIVKCLQILAGHPINQNAHVPLIIQHIGLQTLILGEGLCQGLRHDHCVHLLLRAIRIAAQVECEVNFGHSARLAEVKELSSLKVSPAGEFC
jgi:hypothetical protein